MNATQSVAELMRLIEAAKKELASLTACCKSLEEKVQPACSAIAPSTAWPIPLVWQECGLRELAFLFLAPCHRVASISLCLSVAVLSCSWFPFSPGGGMQIAWMRSPDYDPSKPCPIVIVGALTEEQIAARTSAVCLLASSALRCLAVRWRVQNNLYKPVLPVHCCAYVCEQAGKPVVLSPCRRRSAHALVLVGVYS